MIVLGIILAVIGGFALPTHIFLLGQLINQFVYYDIAVDIPAQAIARGLNLSCSSLVDLEASEGSNTSVFSLANQYFCDEEESNVYSNILDYVCDPDDTFLDRITLFSLYYVGLGSGALIVRFLATMFWNVSAYMQTRRIRRSFYKSVLHQDIGWFDVTVATELSTRLAE